MRKASIVALTAAAVVATTASPLAVQAGTRNSVAESLIKNGYAVIGGTIGNCKPNVIIQGITKPQQKPENVPETEIETPETKPEIENPGNGAETEPEGGTEKPENSNGTTSPELRPEDTPGQGATELSFAEQVVKLVNKERAKAGLAEVTLDKKIEAAALVRAKETEQSFSHTRPNGTSFSTALKEQGVTYRGAGENIAWGQKTPEDVMRAWMNSEGHRANILNAKFTKIGVGYYRNAQGRNYWTQLFTY